MPLEAGPLAALYETDVQTPGARPMPALLGGAGAAGRDEGAGGPEPEYVPGSGLGTRGGFEFGIEPDAVGSDGAQLGPMGALGGTGRAGTGFRADGAGEDATAAPALVPAGRNAEAGPTTAHDRTGIPGPVPFSGDHAGPGDPAGTGGPSDPAGAFTVPLLAGADFEAIISSAAL